MLCQEDPLAQRLLRKSRQLNSGVQALCQGIKYHTRGATRAEAISLTLAGIPKLYCNLNQARHEDIPTLSKERLKERPSRKSCLLFDFESPRHPELLLATDSPNEA